MSCKTSICSKVRCGARATHAHHGAAHRHAAPAFTCGPIRTTRRPTTCWQCRKTSPARWRTTSSCASRPRPTAGSRVGAAREGRRSDFISTPGPTHTRSTAPPTNSRWRCIARLCMPIRNLRWQRSAWRGDQQSPLFQRQRHRRIAPEILPLLAEWRNPRPSSWTSTWSGQHPLDLSRRELAQHDLRRALELNPNGAEPSNHAGPIPLIRGEPREALSYFTITAALDPRDFVWHGIALYRFADLAQFDEAEKACAQARSLGPGSPWAYSISSSLEAGARPNGRSAALQPPPRSIATPTSWRSLGAGALAASAGLMKEAGAAFREAVAADPAGAGATRALLYTGATAALRPGVQRDSGRSSRSPGLGDPTIPSCCSSSRTPG